MKPLVGRAAMVRAVVVMRIDATCSGCASTRYESMQPSDVAGVRGVVAISEGQRHLCALGRGGTIRCWGAHYFGELGSGPDRHELGLGERAGNQPGHERVAGIVGAVAVASGTDFSCAIVSHGGVRCWGLNFVGQVGDGSRLNARFVPVPVTGLAHATAIAAGENHACAVVSDGSVACWGGNEVGQLGDGTQVDRSTPVVVSGIHGATDVAAGTGFSCATVRGGAVRCWGVNAFGQLGDNTTQDRVQPVTVTGISTATRLAAGMDFACALLGDGVVRCWGANDAGQLGDLVRVIRRTPVEVPGFTHAADLAAGGSRACAIVAGGAVSCWGAGHRAPPERRGPVEVAGVIGATALATRDHQSCAVVAGGAISCWVGCGPAWDPA